MSPEVETADLIKLHRAFDADPEAAHREFREKYGREATIVDIEDGRFLDEIDKLISIAQAQDDKKDLTLMESVVNQNTKKET